MAKRKKKGHWFQLVTGPVKMALGAGTYAVGRVVEGQPQDSTTTVKTVTKTVNGKTTVTQTVTTVRRRKK